jgi:S1/P1 Nuclease
MYSRWLFLAAGVLVCGTKTFESFFVSAWGRDGHQIVGNIAWTLLSTNSRDFIRLILNVTNDTKIQQQPTSPCLGYCSPLALVADWADEARYTKEYHWTAPLHYIDVRDDEILPNGCPVVDPTNSFKGSTETNSTCHFNRTRDCPNDFCVAGAIVNYTNHLHLADLSSIKSAGDKIVASTTNDEARAYSSRTSIKKHLRKRRNTIMYSSSTTSTIQPIKYSFNQTLRDSLCFLVHFIGDIHQPLHCSRQTDRGGNSISVKYHEKAYGVKRYSKSYPLNLHGFWDDTIIEQTLQDDFNTSRNLLENSLLQYITYKLIILIFIMTNGFDVVMAIRLIVLQYGARNHFKVLCNIRIGMLMAVP